MSLPLVVLLFTACLLGWAALAVTPMMLLIDRTENAPQGIRWLVFGGILVIWLPMMFGLSVWMVEHLAPLIA